MTGNVDTIKEFLIGLGFDVDEAGLRKFSSVIGSFTVAAVALGAAVVTAAAATVYGVKKIADEYFELDRLATRLHSTTAALKEYEEMGQIMGVSQDIVKSSLLDLNRKMYDTAMGIGRAKKVFAQLGMSVVDAGGKLKPTVEIMDQLALKIASMDRGKALRIMERLGIDEKMLKLFNADFAKLRNELDEINKASGFDIGKAVAESKAFTMSWRAVTQELEKFKIMFSKVIDNIAISAMPKIRAFMDLFKSKLIDMRKTVMENLPEIQGTINSVLGVFLTLANVGGVLLFRALEIIVDVSKKVISNFVALDGTTKTVIMALTGITVAMYALNTAIFASPVTWILAVAAALLLLYDDYKVFQNGGKSLINWNSEGAQRFLYILSLLWGIIKGVFQGTADAITAVMIAVYEFSNWAGKIIESWGPVETWFKKFLNWLGEKFDYVVDKAKGLGLDFLKDAISGFVVSGGGKVPNFATAGGPALDGPLLGPRISNSNQATNQNINVVNHNNVTGVSDPQKAADYIGKYTNTAAEAIARNGLNKAN